jgi:hypothetical protein
MTGSTRCSGWPRDRPEELPKGAKVPHTLLGFMGFGCSQGSFWLAEKYIFEAVCRYLLLVLAHNKTGQGRISVEYRLASVPFGYIGKLKDPLSILILGNTH